MQTEGSGARSGVWWPLDGKSRDHIPHTPLWQGILRIVQVVVAMMIMALTAYCASEIERALNLVLSTIQNWDGQEALPMSWFSFAWTFAYLIYLFAAFLYVPHIYNYWAHMCVEVLANIFWLATFAIMANYTSKAVRSPDNDSVLAILSSTYGTKITNEILEADKNFRHALYPALAFTGLEWLLFMTSTVALAMSLNRHRSSNAPWRGSKSTIPVEHQAQMRNPQYQQRQQQDAYDPNMEKIVASPQGRNAVMYVQPQPQQTAHGPYATGQQQLQQPQNVMPMQTEQSYSGQQQAMMPMQGFIPQQQQQYQQYHEQQQQIIPTYAGLSSTSAPASYPHEQQYQLQGQAEVTPGSQAFSSEPQESVLGNQHAPPTTAAQNQFQISMPQQQEHSSQAVYIVPGDGAREQQGQPPVVPAKVP